MLFFNSHKKEVSPTSNQLGAKIDRRQLAVYIPEELYSAVQMHKIKLGKTATDIVIECLTLSMDFLEPKGRMTSEAHVKLIAQPEKEQRTETPNPTIEQDMLNDAETLRIESKLPIPDKKVAVPSSRSFYYVALKTLRTMEVGDSCVVKGETQRTAVLNVAKKLNMKFTTRKLSKSKKDLSIRAWRIA